MSGKSGKAPFFSIVTVAMNDAWALTKTARSVFEQTFEDFEYVVVDGDSKDGTKGLIEFWKSQGLIDQAISEPDKGVYDAMNKGIHLARGNYVCFINAGDIFYDQNILERVHTFLTSHKCDGVLGWGRLGEQIWASWTESEAYKLASLGYCHQALYVKRDVLTKFPFDDRPHKTDSDTLQLGRMYAAKADIPVVPEIWAIRNEHLGISANLERTKNSIIDTLITEYPELSEAEALMILGFRRECEHITEVLALFDKASQTLKQQLARVVLDTLFLRQSRKLDETQVALLRTAAVNALEQSDRNIADKELSRLRACQSKKIEYLAESRNKLTSMRSEIEKFKHQEAERLQKLSNITNKTRADFVVALTSFPARIRTVEFTIRSLLRQTVRPAEIFLFIGRDEFPNLNWLPKGLRDLESEGLKFCFVEKTCHQYDKVLHGALANAERDYIIVDDDVVYPANSIESLLLGRERFPGSVIANRCHLMPEPKSSGFEAYNNWKREVRFDYPSHRLMPTGAGGVLYPKGFFDESDLLDPNNILSNAPYADDVWLKCLSLAKGMKTFATELSSGSRWYHRYTPSMREGTLMAINGEKGLNDAQISRSFAWLEKRLPAWRSLLLESKVPEVAYK